MNAAERLGPEWDGAVLVWYRGKTIIQEETMAKNEPEVDQEQAEFERKWRATTNKPCSVKDCDGLQYGKSGMCFKHLMRQVGFGER